MSVHMLTSAPLTSRRYICPAVSDALRKLAISFRSMAYTAKDVDGLRARYAVRLDPCWREIATSKDVGVGELLAGPGYAANGM